MHGRVATGTRPKKSYVGQLDAIRNCRYVWFVSTMRISRPRARAGWASSAPVSGVVRVMQFSRWEL